MQVISGFNILLGAFVPHNTTQTHTHMLVLYLRGDFPMTSIVFILS